MKPLKILNLDGTCGENSQSTSNSNRIDTASISAEFDVRIIQNFRLVWLDNQSDEINKHDCLNTITKLRQIVNTVKKFTDVDKCIEFMDGIEYENIFIIITGVLGEKTVPIIHDMAQINCIYIFCTHKERHEKWVKEWPKVRGVYTDITSICEALKRAAQHCDQNSISISFVKTTDGASEQNLDTLDKSFMYTQILKEILLTIDFKQGHITEFLAYCREQLVGNNIELENIDKIKEEYRQHQPIWWYTYQCFLYSMLNRALRTMEVDLIIKMGFFVRDLHNHITAVHSQQYSGQNHLNSFIVYRGQGLSQKDFNQLKQTQGGLLSFNNFLSTSKNCNISLNFARETMATSNLVGVLFIMKIDPSISTTPFANVTNLSYYEKEEEILFSTHSIFRIGQIQQIEQHDRLWQVDLTLTSDDDPQLHALTESMRQETFSGYTGWYRLGEILIKLGHYDKAQQVYEELLNQASHDSQRAFFLHQLGCVTYQKREYEKSTIYYSKAIEIYETRYSSDQALAVSYNDIGLVYDCMGQYSTALLFHEKTLQIYRKTLPPNHSRVASSYHNIGNVYGKTGEYSKALSYCEKALEIYQKTLPSNHPNLATSYYIIAEINRNMGEYSKALTYYEHALNIYERSLSPDHQNIKHVKQSIDMIKKNL